MASQDFLTDKRIVQRNIDKGRIDAKEYEKRLQSLPDLSDNVATVEIDDDLASAPSDE